MSENVILLHMEFTEQDIEKLASLARIELSGEEKKRFGEQIASIFGSYLIDKDGFIDRKKLGEIVFSSSAKLNCLNEIMYNPVMVRLRKKISKVTGVILINCALLAESKILHICNNNVILIDTDNSTQIQRLIDRGLTQSQISTRLRCQYNYDIKKENILDSIDKEKHGNLWTIDNSKDSKDLKKQLTLILDRIL